MSGDPDLAALPDLAGLSPESWRERLAAFAGEAGDFRSLGPAHDLALIEAGPNLLVTFETESQIFAHPAARPLGWSMLATPGWSHLCILSRNSRDWFRTQRIFACFDQLGDDGFFEDFAQVVFWGAGPCGHAACALSAAAPGATVLVAHAQAGLAPDQAGWDRRFPEARRLPFEGRYAPAPRMLQAAARALLLFDPLIPEDAMHAQLLTTGAGLPGHAAHVTPLPMPHFADQIAPALQDLGVFAELVQCAAEGGLSPTSAAPLLRRRHRHAPYLRRLQAAALSRGHARLAHRITPRLAEAATRQSTAPKAP